MINPIPFFLFFVISYFIFGLTLKKKQFFIIYLLWGLSIIFCSFVWGGIQFGISIKQAAILGIFLAANVFFVKFFSSKFKTKNSLFYILSGVVIAPIFFGLWHIKNYPLMTNRSLIYQILYAGLIVGPFLGVVYLQTNSLFLPILLHSLNNTLASTTTKLLTPSIVKYKVNKGLH